MKLSDLVGDQVVDVDGSLVGRVVDVRLVQDGPLIGPFGAALAIEGLVVNPHRTGTYLGFDRIGVRGPWLVAALMRYLHRDSVFVRWDQVDAIGERVELSVPAAQLAPVPALG